MESSTSTHGSTMQTSVVSCFILKSSTNGEKVPPRIGIFRAREQDNNTSHGLRGSIVGTVDENDTSPLTTAWRDLLRVTGLTRASFELERQGKSIVHAPSNEHCIVIAVYPFLFRLRHQDSRCPASQTTWEQDNWTWHEPHEIFKSPSFSGTPLLMESLGSVWFEQDLGVNLGSAGEILARGLVCLRDDHQSGARQLASKALCVLRDVVQALGTGSGDKHTWWARVRAAAWHIWKNGRESMGAAILSVLVEALVAIEVTLDTGPLDLVCNGTVARLSHLIARRKGLASIVPVSNALVGYLEKQFPRLGPASASSVNAESPRTPLSILTLSESSTISHALQLLMSQSHFTDIDLRVLESRPLFEGVSLAASLVQHTQPPSSLSPQTTALKQLKVSIFIDASAAMAAKDVDVVILGADRIASSGAVSNKTGSLPAALGAKYGALLNHGPVDRRAGQVVVLGESEKIAPPGNPHTHLVEEIDPTQVSRNWHSSFNSHRVQTVAACLDSIAAENGDQVLDANAYAQVHVHNVFFEWVPPELVDAYIMENGVWTVGDIQTRSIALGREEQLIFGGL